MHHHIKHLNRVFFRAVFVLAIANSSILTLHAQPNTLATVNRLADEGASENALTRYFFNDVQDSIAHFMANPNEISFYTNKEGFNSRAPISIQSSPLCKKIKGLDDETIALYNLSEPGSAPRQNFWVTVAACLAAHEGAEYWLNNDNENFHKLDTSAVEHQNYLYGTFQLSTERGAAVDIACQRAWASFSILDSTSGAPKEYLTQQRDIPKLVNLHPNKDKTPHQGSLAALANPQKQRFNIMCGVHEIFRAAVSGKKEEQKCLSPFHIAQNRFGPLRRKSAEFKKCMSKLASPIMKAGKDTASIHEAIKATLSRSNETSQEQIQSPGSEH
jgi:hypothetical protein